MTAGLSLKQAAGWLCAVSLAQVLGHALLLSTSKLWFAAVIEEPPLLWALLIVTVVFQVSLALCAIAASRVARQAVLGTAGRGRLLLLVAAASLHLLVTTASAGIVLWAAHVAQGHLIGGSISGLLFALTELANYSFNTSWIAPTLETCIKGAWVTSIAITVLSTSCWFLVAADRRIRFWKGFDVVAVIAFAVGTVLWPLDPEPGNAVELIQAILRLSVTSIVALRLALRLLTPFLTAIERVGFRSMVAARHLRAKKTRFLAANGTLSILAVSVASCMLVTVLSVMGGFRNDLKNKILGSHAHIVIDRGHEAFDHWQPVVDDARRTSGVVGATPYLQGEVMVSSLAAQAGAVLRGIDPETVGEVTDLEKNLTHGKLWYLSNPTAILDPEVQGLRGQGIVRDLGGLLGDATDAPKPQSESKELPAEPVLPGIIVGKELARNLRLVVGDRVHLVSPYGDLGPSGPIPKSRPFRVVGVFYSGMYEYDMKYAYIKLDVSQRFLGQGERISGVEIKVSELDEAPEIAAAVQQNISRPDLVVRDWQELNQHLFGALALEKLAMFIALGIAIVVAGFSVFGTLTLLVQEKRREVGILKALGASPQSVIRIFLLEGLLIGLAGATTGLGLGFVVTFAAEHFGIKMNPEVYYIDRLPVLLDPTEFGLVGTAAVVVCMVATLLPAVQASRVRPVDALRYD